MKIKIVSLSGLLVLALGIGALAPAHAAEAPAVNDPGTAATSAFLCGLSAPKATDASQKSPMAAAIQKSVAFACGACSDFSCRLLFTGATCAVKGGVQYKCFDFSGISCPQDGKVDCRCAGNIP